LPDILIIAIVMDSSVVLGKPLVALVDVFVQ
jgi:hypothetical protein